MFFEDLTIFDHTPYHEVAKWIQQAPYPTSDREVICGAKPLRSYLLTEFINQYINKHILLLYYIINIMFLYNREQLSQYLKQVFILLFQRLTSSKTTKYVKGELFVTGEVSLL